MTTQIIYDLEYLNRKYKITKRGNSFYVLIPMDIAKYLNIDRNTTEVNMLIHQIVKNHRVIDLITLKKKGNVVIIESDS